MIKNIITHSSQSFFKLFQSTEQTIPWTFFVSLLLIFDKKGTIYLSITQGVNKC